MQLLRCPCPDHKPRMTRGFHHPAETFFKNHLHAVRSYPRPPKICRRSLLRVLQRHSKIFHSVLHAKGRRPCQKAHKPHLTHCRSIYYICIYQTFPYFCGMKKDFNTGLRKGIEADRVKLTRRRKLLLRDMGLAEDLERGLKRLEKRFRTGLLSDTGRTIALDKPVCIVFV